MPQRSPRLPPIRTSVERQARSILCLPLLNQAKLIGVLYLENNLTPRVFAPARIAVLKLLASQAAISLENTRLYRDLAEREAKIRRLVDANIIGIFIWDFRTVRLLDANDAFLHMVEYDREDLAAGRRALDEHDAAGMARCATCATVEELKATGTVQPFEKEYFHKDGSRVPVLIGARRIRRATRPRRRLRARFDRAQASGSRSTRKRAPLPRGADGAGAREPRRHDGPAHGLDRS